MRSESELTVEEIDPEPLRHRLDLAIVKHGGGRKGWYNDAKKRFPDIPKERALYHYTSVRSRREKRRYEALLAALDASSLGEPEQLISFASAVPTVLDENSLYERINAIIDSIEVDGSRKEIRLCAMHGTDQSRREREPKPPPAWADFAARMTRCTNSPEWRVDILYNVPAKGRLDQIRQRLAMAEEAENHEVRAYGIEGSLQVLCPMIIGEHHAFLGISHPRYYRTQHAIYLQGAESMRFIERYWNILWSRARIIRSEAGEITSELERLEQELNLRGRRRDDWQLGDVAQAIDAVKRIGG